MRETWGSIPGWGRSSGEGTGNPLQYSCLEKSMDGGAWWATVHGVTKSQTRLSDFTFTFVWFSYIKKLSYRQVKKHTQSNSGDDKEGLTSPQFGFPVPRSYLLCHVTFTSLVVQTVSVCLQCARPGFDPWVGKILWRRQWHPTPVLLPGKCHGRRSLVRLQSMGS